MKTGLNLDFYPNDLHNVQQNWKYLKTETLAYLVQVIARKNKPLKLGLLVSHYKVMGCYEEKC